MYQLNFQLISSSWLLGLLLTSAQLNHASHAEPAPSSAPTLATAWARSKRRLADAHLLCLYAADSTVQKPKSIEP